jgi:MFS family permease
MSVHPILEFTPIYFSLGLIVTCLLLAVGHWFPWEKQLHTEDITRIFLYAIGVGALLAGMAVWLFLSGSGWLWWYLLAFPVAGGLATVLFYGIDAMKNKAQRDKLQNHDA